MAEEFIGRVGRLPDPHRRRRARSRSSRATGSSRRHPADPRHGARASARCAPSSAAASTTTSSRPPTRRPPAVIAYEVRASLLPLGAAHRRSTTSRSRPTPHEPGDALHRHRATRSATRTTPGTSSSPSTRSRPRRAPTADGRRRLMVPLPAPNLDDRRFQDLVDDAKRLVQQRCPEWTDHNVSDPGVTLIETVRLDDRPAPLPAQPRARPQLRQVPRADRRAAVPARAGARRRHVLAVRAAAGAR